MKHVDLDESTSLLDQRECKPTEITVKEQQKIVRVGESSLKNCRVGGFTIWKDVRKSALRGIVS